MQCIVTCSDNQRTATMILCTIQCHVQSPSTYTIIIIIPSNESNYCVYKNFSVMCVSQIINALINKKKKKKKKKKTKIKKKKKKQKKTTKTLGQL